MGVKLLKATVRNSKTFVKNFRDFVRDTNFVDVAIGLLIATAIKDLATSFQDNVITPLINSFFQWLGISSGGESPTVTILGAQIGLADFLASILTFFIIMFIAFMILFLYSQFRERLNYEKPDEKSKETELLEQILEELKKDK